MTMQMPSYIAAAQIAGKPLGYAWDITVSRAIRHPLDTEHRRLSKAISLVDIHAAFALVLAEAEWVAWRFQGIIDIGDALARIEAGYAALVDPRYAEIPEPSEPFPPDLQDAHGPLKLARMLISEALDYYREGDRIVAEETLSMALLARHVCPEPKAFDAWLSAALRNGHKAFPAAGAKPGQRARIPPDFFDSTGDRDAAASASAVAGFLAGLDPGSNPYLRDAKALRAAGFTGTPYRHD